MAFYQFILVFFLERRLPLPPPAPRQHLHTREAVYRGYRRESGGWDIEAELRDTKTYDMKVIGETDLPAGTPVHHLAIRMTLDDALVVQDILVAMDGTPHDSCSQAITSLAPMIGVKVGSGWRKAIETRLGGVQGCTHLRELLFNMATATFQSVHPGESVLRSDKPPLFLGQCMTWDTRGPLVQRIMPQFYQLDINRNTTLKT
jgi:hypothetical protein